MSAIHIVSQGEGISSIADSYGFSPLRIWHDPANVSLRRKRIDPNILLPGDEVVIPDMEAKHQTCATERRHRFKRVGIPAILRLQMLREGRPRANEPYTLVVDGRILQGTTDAEGVLECYVPTGCRTGTLRLGNEQEEFEVSIGQMDPINEMIGIQKRLGNLGYYSGPADGETNTETEEALRLFQSGNSLPQTGKADADTARLLQNLHDTTALAAKQAARRTAAR